MEMGLGINKYRSTRLKNVSNLFLDSTSPKKDLLNLKMIAMFVSFFNNISYKYKANLTLLSHREETYCNFPSNTDRCKGKDINFIQWRSKFIIMKEKFKIVQFLQVQHNEDPLLWLSVMFGLV